MTNSMKAKQHIAGFDYLRLIAAFMVVGIHACVTFLSQNKGTVGFFAVSVGLNLFSASVPLFFMVSGAVNLQGEGPVTAPALFRKKLPRLLIPFAVWSLLYTLARVAMGKIPFSFESFYSLLYQPAYYQFWFMYTLLAITLLLPFIKMITDRASKRQLEYLLLLWAVFAVAVPALSRYVPGFALSQHVDLILCEGYVGYYLLGHYLLRYADRFSVPHAILLLVGGVLLSVAESALCYGMRQEWYTSYLTAGTVLLSVGSYLLFVKCGEKSCRWSGSWRSAAALTMTVYYVHMLIHQGIELLGFTGKTPLGVLLKTAVVFLLSLGYAFLQQFLFSRIWKKKEDTV